jgi:hypothetical protein
VLGCVLVVGVALAGCTPQPPTTTPPPSPSVVASPSPTPTTTPTPDAAVKPERPTAMDEVSAAGAEAAAVYFLQLYPYVYATGDLEEWRAMSHPECVFCTSVITNVEEEQAEGRRSTGGGIGITGAISREITTATWYSVSLEGYEEPWSTFDTEGNLVEEHTAREPHTFELAVIRDADRWLVRAVQVDDAPE